MNVTKGNYLLTITSPDGETTTKHFTDHYEPIEYAESHPAVVAAIGKQKSMTWYFRGDTRTLKANGWKFVVETL